MKTIYFEVTRRHSEVDGWAEPAEAAFVLSDTVKKTIRRIKRKLSQLQSSEINIVVIWSDTPKLLSQDVAEAFEHIKQDDPEKCKDLSGVLYTEGGGVDSATLKEYYLLLPLLEHYQTPEQNSNEHRTLRCICPLLSEQRH